jgi:hypothetical protein
MTRYFFIPVLFLAFVFGAPASAADEAGLSCFSVAPTRYIGPPFSPGIAAGVPRRLAWDKALRGCVLP